MLVLLTLILLQHTHTYTPLCLKHRRHANGLQEHVVAVFYINPCMTLTLTLNVTLKA
jgi:hypothetical protein